MEGLQLLFVPTNVLDCWFLRLNGVPTLAKFFHYSPNFNLDLLELLGERQLQWA